MISQNLIDKGKITQNQISEILISNGFEVKESSLQQDKDYGIDLFASHNTSEDHKDIKIDCKKIQYHTKFDFSLFVFNLKRDIDGEYKFFVRSPFSKQSQSDYIAYCYDKKSEDAFLVPFEEFVCYNFFDSIRDYRLFMNFIQSLDRKNVEDYLEIYNNIPSCCMALKNKIFSFLSKKKYNKKNRFNEIYLSFDEKDYEDDSISFILRIPDKSKIYFPKKSMKLKLNK